MASRMTPELLDSKVGIIDRQLGPLPYATTHVQQPGIGELLANTKDKNVMYL